MNMFRVAICGSKLFASKLAVKTFVELLPADCKIITTPQTGVCQWVFEMAKQMNRSHQVISFPVRIDVRSERLPQDQYIKYARQQRREIVNESDLLVIFWQDDNDIATSQLVQEAVASRIPVFIIHDEVSPEFGSWQINSILEAIEFMKAARQDKAELSRTRKASRSQ